MQQFPPNEEPKKEEIAKGERKHNCRFSVLLLLPPKVIFGSPELNSPGEEEREGVAVPKNGLGGELRCLPPPGKRGVFIFVFDV